MSQTSPDSTYRYQSLGQRGIRLLSISSDTCDKGIDHGSTISDILVFPLDSAPAYSALSYTWGQTKAENTMALATRQALPITENLQEALPYVLAQCKTDFIWIDQLCINQNDNAERSQQVALMGEIFSKADVVLIWLGVTIQHYGILTWLLDQLQDRGRTSGFREFIEEGYRSPIDLSQWWDTFHRIEHDNGKEIVTQTLLDVFRLPWFCRLWVMQEAVLATTAVFIIGTLVMSPLALCGILAMVCDWRRGDVPGEIAYDEPGCRTFKYMMAIRDKDGTFLKSFSQILTNHRALNVRGAFQATDLKDYVYAIVGMRKSSSNAPLAPDYSLSVAQIFTQAAVAYMTSHDLHEHLGMLKLCDGIDYVENNLNQLLELPSFVPDWSRQHQGFDLGLPDLRTPSLALDRKHWPSFSDALSNVLTVKGKWITRVSRISPGWLKQLRGRFRMSVEPGWPSNPHPPLHAIESRVDPSITDILSGISSEMFESRALGVMLDWPAARDNRGPQADEIAEVIRRYQGNSHLFYERALNEDFEGDPVLLQNLVTPSSDLELHAGRFVEFCSNESIKRCSHGTGLYECKRPQCRDAYNLYVYLHELYSMDSRAEIYSTEDGRLGLAHERVREQDEVFILHGLDIPVILRKASSGQYQYVTGCYLEHAMRGEGMTWSEDEANDIMLV